VTGTAAYRGVGVGENRRKRRGIVRRRNVAAARAVARFALHVAVERLRIGRDGEVAGTVVGEVAVAAGGVAGVATRVCVPRVLKPGPGARVTGFGPAALLRDVTVAAGRLPRVGIRLP